MDGIKVSVPYEYNAISRMADFFHGLALDFEKGDAGKAPSGDDCSSGAAVSDALGAVAPPEDPDHGTGVATEVPTTETRKLLGMDPPATGAPTPADPPATPAPPTPTPTPPAPELDADGLPWDMRIHASSKKKIANGTWRMKRGVDVEVVEFVVNELRALMAATVPTPAAPANTPAAPAAPPVSFPVFMQQLTTSDITTADVLVVLNRHNIASVPLLAGRPDLIPAISAELFGGGA